MIIHKQGFKIIGITFLLLLIVNYLAFHFNEREDESVAIINVFSVLILGLMLVFFRNPKRKIIENEFFVISPADGQIVAKEIVTETEFFNQKRVQISIFMSILNVHKNWVTTSGEVIYSKYNKGKFLIASLPKSSELNESWSVVIRDKNGIEILVKQVAGFIARRIVCNLSVDDKVRQADELGFIKFGSRVDLFLPVDSKVLVNIGDKVFGGLTVIADLS